jgi:hypothetical protein
MLLVTENQLDMWVRGNSRDAQGLIVELVRRLTAASCPRPRERRFPSADSIGQHGPDGILDVALGFDQFVPDGRSFWEIGTGVKAGDKATTDYKDRTEETPEAVRTVSTFIFVTPLSARRDWEHTWKENAQGAWLEERRNRREWKDVRVIDGTKLVDWIQQFLPVALWVAQKTNGVPAQQIETPEQHWSMIRTFGEPPPLTTNVFLANRDEACAKLKDVFNGTSVQLKLETHFPNQVVDFVAAYLAALDPETRADASGRCLIVSGLEAWNDIVAQYRNFILVVDPALDLSGDPGTKLIQSARRAGHAIIYGGPQGGIPDPTSVPLRAPQSYQLQEALKEAGYSEERARTLAQKSDGNLGSLLRCLQNLSLMPEWADASAAADLAIAAVLGSWNEKSDADRAAVERLSKKAYGEWIGNMREIALRPGTPLIHKDGSWKCVARYEAWYALGSRLFDEHLDRVLAVATLVLKEKDPQFDLPGEKRYAAAIHGKILSHTHLLRIGLAESLALLGNHPKALTSCTLGKAEVTAVLAVRAVLGDADWLQWASVNDLLPLLAEAAPGEFLDAVEQALNSDPCPFDQIFAQEGDGFLGRNYMTGLLWALETLAWDTDYLSRVVICLGELAARDPGGRWANRPARSLTTILLPWMPQTCAPVYKRVAAVRTLLAELPNIGWKLLISLLPQAHSVSTGTRKPAWRDTIPAGWSNGITRREYWEQVTPYSEMAISAAKSDREKLAEVINEIENLPPPAQEVLLVHLDSAAVRAMPESDRLIIWTRLVELIHKHRKFSDAEWAMKSEQIDRIGALAARLAPTAPSFRHRRLFGEDDFNLYEEKGNYEEQSRELEKRRQRAIEEVLGEGGTPAVLEFAKTVQSPWRVGMAFGSVAASNADAAVLPALLEFDQKQLCMFAAGFVLGRFRCLGWEWVDRVETSQWTAAQIGQFLSFLPFAQETWERSKRLLGQDESAYWIKTAANPYEENNLELAIDQLLVHGRPYAAIRCLDKMLHDKRPLDTARAVRALLAAPGSSEPPHSLDAYEAVEIIKALQNDRIANPEDLFRVEWAYLPLLENHADASPKFLEHQLAKEPGFFCEIIRLVFISKKEELPDKEPTEKEKSTAANAYRLLSGWRIPPGLSEDGAYNGEALKAWLQAVKKECIETGHLEVAMTIAGQVLVHVPPDADGLWIQRAAAAILNAKDAEDMRGGFRTELFNSRGVHTVDPTGRPERELAANYRTKAESIDGAGYSRLAATLRKLADMYEREAERGWSREPFDD